VTRRIHLDTDIGGDTDDLCALAMLLGWPDVELVGVSTCSDSGGLRAGLARYALRLAGQEGVPVVAGADGSVGGYRVPDLLTNPAKLRCRHDERNSRALNRLGHESWVLSASW
jgi:hypothetical protein